MRKGVISNIFLKNLSIFRNCLYFYFVVQNELYGTMELNLIP